MYVIPAGRGRGYARVVLAHLERTAADAGADWLVLETGDMQPEAIALYESFGFVREGYRHLHYRRDGTYFDAILMALATLPE